jgi:FAD/FMN-containing dehydrogenase
VGRLVETNSTGPLRLGYGAWRDLMLGAQFRNGRGELITAGGRTVKNVAGYDLTKFLVGQRRIFGSLVTITTRTYKRPSGAILATFRANPRLVARLIPSPAKPQWAMLTSEALLCGYMGDERALSYYSTGLSEYKPLSIQPRSLDDDISHRAALWRGRIRASVPPARLGEFLTGAKPANWSADAAFGIVLCDGDDAAIDRSAQQVGGLTDLSQPSPPQRSLLERLKNSFDPENKLAPLP